MKKLISLILVFSLLLSFSPVYATGVNGSLMSRDELVSNYNSVEQAVFTAAKSEYGYASNSTSSTLAWAASYMLESYANMYKNTGDIRYLKSLGLQFREALSNINYDYGEDKPGWDAPNYSIKRMPDPEFDKTFISATDPDSVSTAAWMRKYGSDSDRVNVEANVGVTNRGLHIVSGGGKLQGAKISIPEYASGTIFQFSIYAKNTAPARAYITDSNGVVLKTLDGKEYITFSSPNRFANHITRYKVPAEGGTLSIHLESSDVDATGDIYFDTVVFQQAAQFHVHDTIVLSSGAKFIKAVYADKELAETEFEAGKTYKEVADEFLIMIGKFIRKWEFCWREVGNDMGVYVWPLDDSSSYAGNTLPHNQYITMASVMMSLYDATGNTDCLDRAERMLRFFKSKITTVGEGDEAYCYWNYYDPAFTEKAQSSRVEDISHGCLELGIAITAYENGIVFNESDMKKFANAFVKMLWNGDIENPVLYNYLMDNSTNPLYHKEITSVSNVRDWAALGKWNKNIPIAIINYLAVNKPTSGHPTKMLTYSFAYPFIFNPLTKISVIPISGCENQIEDAEFPIELSIAGNPGVDEDILGQTSWTVSKDSNTITSLGTGASISYIPSGAGTYLFKAVNGELSSEYAVKVSKAPKIKDPPEIKTDEISGAKYLDVSDTVSEISFDISLEIPEETSGSVLATVYNDIGILLDVKRYKATDIIDVLLDITDGKYIKLFWWSDSNLIPYIWEKKYEIR